MLLSLSAPGLKPTATHLPYLYPQVLNLACTQSYVLRKQTRILEFLIKLGAKLLEMQNYNALILVMITPNSFTILLLKRTWEGVGDKAQALFENMNKAVSHQRNYAVGNPTHCASPELPGVQIIDFDKYQKMMKIMDEIERFQVKFNFLEVSSITAYIHFELHATRRSQLDAIGTDYALQAIETILSSNLGWNQYDIVSAAQIESLAKLAEIWASANPFLSVADGRSRNISSNQLIELGEHHNKVMDARAKKLTCHGSFWAALLGANLLFAFTNGLYAIAAVSRLSPKLNKTLAMERVNGSSTALIQAHRDSVREGYNLAFSPDLVTDGLVSAAITVLQLASEGKQPGKQSGAAACIKSLQSWQQFTPPLKNDLTLCSFFPNGWRSWEPNTWKKVFHGTPVAANYIRMVCTALP
ncbi:hypothetical protein H4Q26_008331 [Puccinia striiformis f. sp. tritici PST-130]|nr:hypothetical protein H4Q26_008331 [Puccinia striiformis f. sp. tritici PST-130]